MRLPASPDRPAVRPAPDPHKNNLPHSQTPAYGSFNSPDASDHAKGCPLLYRASNVTVEDHEFGRSPTTKHFAINQFRFHCYVTTMSLRVTAGRNASRFKQKTAICCQLRLILRPIKGIMFSILSARRAWRCASWHMAIRDHVDTA